MDSEEQQHSNYAASAAVRIPSESSESSNTSTTPMIGFTSSLENQGGYHHVNASLSNKDSTCRRCWTLSITLLLMLISLVVIVLLLKTFTSDIREDVDDSELTENELKWLKPVRKINSSKYIGESTLHYWATYKLDATNFVKCKPSLGNRPCVNKMKYMIYTTNRGLIGPWRCSHDNQVTKIAKLNYNYCKRQRTFIWSKKMDTFTVNEDGLYAVHAQMRIITRSNSPFTIIIYASQYSPKTSKLLRAKKWRSCSIDNRSETFLQKKWNKAEEKLCLLHGVRHLRAHKDWISIETADFSVPLYYTETFIQIIKIK